MASRTTYLKETLIGWHAVQEALIANRRRCYRLRVRDSEAQKLPLKSLLALARQKGVEVQHSDRQFFQDLDRRKARHQGCALEVGPFPLSDWNDVWTHAEARAEQPFLLIADHIQDPQNLGALIRAAENCGVHGVIVPKDRACPLSPAVSQASAGGLEHMFVVRVTNIAREFKQLREKGIWVAGLDSTDPGAQDFETMDLDRPLALVVGNEGTGLSSNVLKNCDFLLRLRMWGRIDSYNAANAASISMYLARQARRSQ